MVGKGDDLILSTRRWQVSVEQAEALRHKTGPEQFLQVRYEDMVTQPADTLQRICHFSNIEYIDEMLDFWQSPTTIEHKHYKHHRNLGKPLSANSIGRWAERLTLAEQQYVLAKTSESLKHLGYLK